jgi:hypothetical protein
LERSDSPRAANAPEEIAMRLAVAIVTLAATNAIAALSGPYIPEAAGPFAYDGPYSKPAGMAGSTAVPYYGANRDPRILGWATEVAGFVPGKQNIAKLDSDPAAYGDPEDALGASDAYGSENFSVVSLGDGGSITLKFPEPIGNGPGPDLAVFENAFDDNFLELAFVEVSSNGTTFHRFPAVSLTQTNTQLDGFGLLDTSYLHNLAGKFRTGFGTPFDLAELAGIPDLDISMVTHVRIVDVVGSIDPLWGRLDSQGHLINDPWSTEWPNGGFDLDAVAYMNVIPEPTTTLILGGAAVATALRRRRRR